MDQWGRGAAERARLLAWQGSCHAMACGRLVVSTMQAKRSGRIGPIVVPKVSRNRYSEHVQGGKEESADGMVNEAPRVSALSLLKQREDRENAAAGDDEAKEQFMTFDLGRLSALNTTPVAKCSFSDARAMQERARDSVQLIVGRLFSLPSEPADHGRLADLPAPTTVLPREKPIPKPKPPTRWEQFAKEKGIQKKKKDRMVYDDATKEWRPQWGKSRVPRSPACALYTDRAPCRLQARG